jgi:hypothetical protein
MKWVEEALSPGLKRPGHESGHSPPCIAQVNNGGAIPSPSSQGLHLFLDLNNIRTVLDGDVSAD